MKKHLIILAAALIGAVSVINAQESAQKAKIYIKKSDNGKVSEIEEEIPIKEGEDLEKILNALGVWEDFQGLNEGETIEINVRRFENGDWKSALDMAFSGQENPSAFLGVMITDNENGEGVEITEIIKGSAAEQSPLLKGDIILEIEKQKINSTDELINTIREQTVGDEVKITYSRDGKTKNTKVVLGEKPSNDRYLEFPNIEEFEFNFDEKDFDFPELNFSESLEERAFLGVSPSEEPSEKGVKIGMITSESSAETMGLLQNDVILSINKKSIDSFEQLAKIIAGYQPGDVVELDILRNQSPLTLSGALGSRSFGQQDNIHFFKDFKGVDENGDLIYDFELNMDSEEQEAHLQEIEKILEEQKILLEEFQKNLDLKSQMLDVTITIDNISEEEINRVNENASPKLKADNNLEMDEFSFFPNPSAGEFNLNFSLAKKGDLQVLIYDQTGSIVYKKYIGDFKGTFNDMIDLSAYNNGIYFMQIIQNNKSYSKKLIKG